MDSCKYAIRLVQYNCNKSRVATIGIVRRRSYEDHRGL